MTIDNLANIGDFEGNSMYDNNNFLISNENKDKKDLLN